MSSFFFFYKIRDHSTSLEMHITHLQKRIASLKALLDESPTSGSQAVELSPSGDGSDGENGQVIMASRMLKKAHIEPVEDHQHPLAITTSIPSPSTDSVFAEIGSGFAYPSSGQITSSSQLKREIDSVCLDWRSLRNIKGFWF